MDELTIKPRSSNCIRISASGIDLDIIADKGEIIIIRPPFVADPENTLNGTHFRLYKVGDGDQDNGSPSKEG